MKIKNEVRYALQIVYYLTLHRDKDIISSNEISAEENIPRLFCLRIIKQLEKDGLINRKVYAQIPPKVEYSLTDIGKKFQSVLNELEIWGNDYIDYLKENREAV
mgnify:CR=1 FL=1